ncbi:Hypothetical protein ACI5QM_00859 [Bacillus subtilis]
MFPGTGLYITLLSPVAVTFFLKGFAEKLYGLSCVFMNM